MRTNAANQGANQRQHLNKTQHQIGTFATSKPLNHAGLAGLLLTIQNSRKNADGQALGAPWPVA